MQPQPASGRKRATLERTYAAPVTKVWKAWTDGKQWGSWFSDGPAQVDLRVGGRYSTADQDAGEYRAVAKNERLSFTWEHPHHAKTSPGSVVTLTFSEDEPGQTRLRLTHSGLSDKDARDLKEGWSWALDSLDSYLRTRKPLKWADWETQRGPTSKAAQRAVADKPSPAKAAASSRALGQRPMRWELTLQASPQKVWQALTADIEAWWTHGFNGHAPVVLEPRIGGRFYEAFDDIGNGALFGTVTYCEPPKLLRYAGSLGMRGAVMNVVAFELEPVGDSTRLRCSMDTLGAAEAAVAKAYRHGWQELMANLRAWVEDGQRGGVSKLK